MADVTHLNAKILMILFSKVISTTTVFTYIYNGPALGVSSIYGCSYSDVKMLYKIKKIFPLQGFDGHGD